MTLTYILIVVSSGLFLGWLLGSKDTVNLFGSSVSSKMLDFKKAAIIAGVFVLLGAVFSGQGTTRTIHELGNTSSPVIAFIIALTAALVVLLLTRIKMAVSTSQTIVGSIVGWLVFSHTQVDIHQLSGILLAWILAPVCGMIISAILFLLIRFLIKKSQIHILKLHYYLRIGLVAGIALSAFGLGANNIGNVIGIFYHLSPNISLDFGWFSFSGLQLLCLLGAIAIISGIITYSYRSPDGTGNDVLSLMPEAAIVVLFAQAMVLMLFSSPLIAGWFHSAGLPYFVLVPVSSTQVVVGAVLGIGWVKGAREIDGKTLTGIGTGWITAPLSAGLLTYAILYMLHKAFGYAVPVENVLTGNENLNIPVNSVKINMALPGLILIVGLVLSLFLYLYYHQQKLVLKAEKDMLIQQNRLYYSQKAMNDLEMRTIAMENEALNSKLKTKRKEFMDIALNINEQQVFLEKISAAINEIIKTSGDEERSEKLKELSVMIRQKMSFTKEKKEFYLQIEDIHKDFNMKLKTLYPNLTELEKRLAGMLRLNLSSKEMASLLNISPKSVEVARYRLKKKMNLQKEKALTDFINNL
jgi:inorganic phosphate transporter, PiT family